MDEQYRQHIEAYSFFRSLQEYLNAYLPTTQKIRELIPQIVSASKSSMDARHKAFPEGAFLNEFIAPGIHSFLCEKHGFTTAGATRALLSESFRQLSGIASASPARSQPHPFKKALGMSAQDIIAQWRGLKSGNALVQSCPDLALREPCQFRTLIEGKYFDKGGHVAASSALANDIFQSFFYLALTKLEETKTHPAWNYDYSCLIACDATVDGTMIEAWLDIEEEVRRGIWDGANIFVMILRREYQNTGLDNGES